MDARKREIEHLDGEIARLEQQVTSECVGIGRHLARLDASRVRSEELQKYFRSAEALRRSIDGFRADIESVRVLHRRVETLDLEIGENSRRRGEIERERKSRFMEIGAASFTLFRTLPDREPYRPLFEEVLRLDHEIDQLQGEHRDLAARREGKGILEWVRLKGRSVLLGGDINRLEKAKTAAYEAAGARLVEGDFARHTEGPLRALFDAAAERRRSAEALAAENDRKVEEIERARQDLKRRGADQEAEAAVRELDARIAALEKESDVVYCWMGQHYVEHDLAAGIADDALAGRREGVRRLRESIARKRTQIHKLKAEMEIEEIQRREKSHRARRKQFEEEMRVKERQIGVVDIEINMGLRRLEELRRVLAGEAPYTEAPILPPTPDLYPRPPEGPPAPPSGA